MLKIILGFQLQVERDAGHLYEYIGTPVPVYSSSGSLQQSTWYLVRSTSVFIFFYILYTVVLAGS